MTILKGRVDGIDRDHAKQLRARLLITDLTNKYLDTIWIPNSDGLALDDEVIVEVRRNNRAVHTSPLAATGPMTAEEVAEVARG